MAGGGRDESGAEICRDNAVLAGSSGRRPLPVAKARARCSVSAGSWTLWTASSGWGSALTTEAPRPECLAIHSTRAGSSVRACGHRPRSRPGSWSRGRRPDGGHCEGPARPTHIKVRPMAEIRSLRDDGLRIGELSRGPLIHRQGRVRVGHVRWCATSPTRRPAEASRAAESRPSFRAIGAAERRDGGSRHGRAHGAGEMTSSLAIGGGGPSRRPLPHRDHVVTDIRRRRRGRVGPIPAWRGQRFDPGGGGMRRQCSTTRGCAGGSR